MSCALGLAFQNVPVYLKWSGFRRYEGSFLFYCLCSRYGFSGAPDGHPSALAQKWFFPLFHATTPFVFFLFFRAFSYWLGFAFAIPLW